VQVKQQAKTGDVYDPWTSARNATGDVLASPEVATLSAIAHGDDPETAIAVATVLAGFEDARGPVYYDYLRGQLAEPIRIRLEEIMNDTVSHPSDVFTNKFEARGEARGRACGQAELVTGILQARGLELDAAQQETLTARTDSDQLIVWATRAATAISTAEVFKDA
jgi:hypothetical protein